MGGLKVKNVTDFSNELDLVLSSQEELYDELFQEKRLTDKTFEVFGKEFHTLHFPSTTSSDSLDVRSAILNVASYLKDLIDFNKNMCLFEGKVHSVEAITDWYCVANQERKTFDTFNEAKKYFDGLGYEEVSVVDKVGGQLAERVVVPKGVKVASIYYSPANRFLTVDTVAKKGYVFSIKEENDVTEYLIETNFLCVLDKPELVVKLRNI